MAKTIKIIELLNKIANGEEVAEKIQYGITKYKYYREMQDYKDEDNYYLFDCISDSAVKAFLNDTVEIIEDEQEIDIQRNKRNKRYSCFFINRCKKNY